MKLAEISVLSPEEVKTSYNSPLAAERYRGYFIDSPRHRHKDQREKQCVRKALGHLPIGSCVLDLPCGAGRMYGFLKDLGFNVTGADCSPFMVNAAQNQARTHNQFDPLKDTFYVSDALKTDFHDKQFDAVLSNRLFHHFSDPLTRQQALRELSRISSGPIVVSFFSTMATDTIKHYYKKYIRREAIKDRIPISPLTFAKDVRAAGLKIVKWKMARPLISKQWYVVLQPAEK